MEESPAKKFAKWMSKRRQEIGLTLDLLEARTGIRKQHLSTLERAVEHSLTGKAVTPKRTTVEKIAKGLEAPISEALEAAGYAPTTTSIKEGHLDFLLDRFKALLINNGIEELDEAQQERFLHYIGIVAEHALPTIVDRSEDEKSRRIRYANRKPSWQKDSEDPKGE